MIWAPGVLWWGLGAFLMLLVYTGIMGWAFTQNPPNDEDTPGVILGIIGLGALVVVLWEMAVPLLLLVGLGYLAWEAGRIALERWEELHEG